MVGVEGEVVDEKEYTVLEFIKGMPEGHVPNWRTGDKSNLWVFWGKEDQTSGGMIPETLRSSRKIKDCIKSALFGASNKGYNTLIQFWEPMKIEGKLILKTLNQPFGIGIIEKGFCEYRNLCMGYQINIESDDDDRNFGFIGRAFKHEQVESNPPMIHNSKVEPLLFGYSILKCCAHRSLAVPVFETSGSCCVGVLEIVANYEVASFCGLFSLAGYIFKAAGLKSASHLSFDMEEIPGGIVPDEITEAMQVVCKTYKVPLAQIWIPFSNDGPDKKKGYSGRYLRCSLEHYCSKYLDDENKCYSSSFIFQGLDEFSTICHFSPLGEGQGVVGKAGLSSNPCFCRDVSQLSMAEYPLSRYTSKYGLNTACFAICLQSNTRSKRQTPDYYVLEFFFPSSLFNTTLLDSLLSIVMKHLQSFQICSSQGLEEEIFVQVVKISTNDQETDSFKIRLIPAEKSSEPATSSSSFRISSGAKALKKREYRKTRISISFEDLVKHFGKKRDDAAESLGVSKATLQRICRQYGIDKWPLPNREIKRLPSSGPEKIAEVSAMKEALRKNERDAEQCSVLAATTTTSSSSSSERISSGTEALKKREYRTKKISLSREDLINHSGQTLSKVALSLGVSKSTLRRVCRDNNIKRWPPPKMVNSSSTSIMKHVEEVVPKTKKLIVHSFNSNPKHVEEEVVPKKRKKVNDLSSSCSPQQPMHTITSPLEHTTKAIISALEQDVKNVTIKATFGDDIIRFDIPSSSSMEDLLGKVTTRLPALNDGSFKIKYQDEDDDCILIACDEDLQQCFNISSTLGKSTIRMLVQPITN